MNQSEKNNKSNLFKSLKRNLSELKEFRLILIIALLLAVISSVLSILAPSRLSDLTDEISKSLNIDRVALEDIGKEIGQNLGSQNPSDIEYNSHIITLDDQHKFMEVITKLNSEGISFDDSQEVSESTQEKLLNAYGELPNSVVNIIEPKLDMNAVWRIAKVLFAFYLISALFHYLQSIMMTEVTNNYARKLRNDVADKINELPLNYFDTNQVGDILSRMTNDVDQIAMSLNDSLGVVTISVTLLVGSIAMMFITNWILALVAIGSSLFGFMFTGLILAKSQKYFKMRQEELGNINGHTEEMISGIEIVKIYNAKEQTVKEFDRLNDNLYTASIKSKFLSGMLHPIMMFVGNFGYVAVSIVGAILASNNAITFGVIVAFMTYVRLFTNPLTRISQALTSLQSSAAASDRVFEFLDEEELKDESQISNYLDPQAVQGEIEFKDVVFKYPSNDEPTIKGFSAKALSGQKIAIVGPTGAGKSTMVNLLMKFYDISEGDIIIDGNSIHDISRENVHDLFTMILQDTWLFKGTVRENIIYNMKNVSEEELNTLINFIGLRHYINTLPNGLDTVISSESVSAGQRQLLTIARGILKDAPFLILDEATSNVDTRTEEVIQEAMDKLMLGRTSFIIAHRLSTIVNSDLILVMDQGNIIEQGTHKELLEKDGFYADLYNSQFSLN